MCQFSTCMSLLRHGCQRHSVLNSQTGSQESFALHHLCPVHEVMTGIWNPLISAQIVNSFGQRKCTFDFFVFCSGKICLICFHGFLFFCFISHLCLLHKINAQTPITAILSTYLIHEFLVNVKCRMDGSHRKPYICLSFDFLIQYSANGTCLTSVSMREYVTSLWLL